MSHPGKSNVIPLSLAEWEYAHRFRDYLELGDERPDSAGFDPGRIAEIERILSGHYADNLRMIRSMERK